MTKEQAEKMKKRKARKRKKQINAIIFLILISVGVFLAFKGISSLVKKTSDALGDSQQGAIQGDSFPESGGVSDETVTPEPTPEQTPEVTPSPPPVLAKPEKTWATTLVNLQNPLPADFAVEVRNIKGTEKQYDTRAADALEQMLSDAETAGFKMYLVSTYRTVAYQQGLYTRKINEYKNKGFDEESAKAEAGKWVAIPGTSEHNLGLAADIVSSTWYNSNSDLTQEFENTEHFTWLINNCYKYGFILRYPKGAEATTGIAYEPWHYRYVGNEAAEYIMSNNITLEEFNQ